MNSDTPTIEKLKQKVQSSGMKFERGGMNPLLQWSIENIIAPAVFRDKKEEGTLTEAEAIWLDRHTYGCAVLKVDRQGNLHHIPFETLSEEDRLRIQTNPKS